MPDNHITKDQLVRVLPKKVKIKVTDELVTTINGLAEDQQLRESFRDNLLSYTNVMQNGKYKLTDYINAVQYVSHNYLVLLISKLTLRLFLRDSKD